jgi:ribosome biogenesis GTPase / thiamine phosphate phosphatase
VNPLATHRTALVPYGWSPRVEALLGDLVAADPDRLTPGRVVRVERIACRVVTAAGELLATADTLPAVGDWVAVDTGTAPAVHAIAERWSALTRLDPHGDRVQVLAADVDLVLITCPADRPSIARVERETVVAWGSGARPLVLVTKADLGAVTLVADLSHRLPGVVVLPVAIPERTGIDALARALAPDRTAVVLGPSGAGKSTLVNALLDEERLATGDVRAEDARGRHTTTARELVVIPTGGVVIDTPGIRSVGLTAESAGGLELAFADIFELEAACRFSDCRHEREPGCAVRTALDTGALHPERYAGFRKLDAEIDAVIDAGEEERRAGRRR